MSPHGKSTVRPPRRLRLRRPATWADAARPAQCPTARAVASPRPWSHRLQDARHRPHCNAMVVPARPGAGTRTVAGTAEKATFVVVRDDELRRLGDLGVCSCG